MDKTWPITEMEEIKRLQAEIDTLHCERLEIEKRARAVADLAIAQSHAWQLDRIRGMTSELVIRMIRNRTPAGSKKACEAQLRRNHDKVSSSSGTPSRI